MAEHVTVDDEVVGSKPIARPEALSIRERFFLLYNGIILYYVLLGK